LHSFGLPFLKAKFGQPPKLRNFGAKIRNSTEFWRQTPGLMQQTTLKNNNVTAEHTSYEHQQKRTDRENQNNGDQTPDGQTRQSRRKDQDNKETNKEREFQMNSSVRRDLDW